MVGVLYVMLMGSWMELATETSDLARLARESGRHYEGGSSGTVSL
jgi:hypothetical protein